MKEVLSDVTDHRRTGLWNMLHFKIWQAPSLEIPAIEANAPSTAAPKATT